jgi:hypothetical protein
LFPPTISTTGDDAFLLVLCFDSLRRNPILTDDNAKEK